MNFPVFRKKFRGPVNKLAYFGMLGDVVVIGGMYYLWQERKARKQAKILANREKQIQNNL